MVEKCRARIAKEYRRLAAAALLRGPPNHAVSTADVWLWVARQGHLADRDVDAILHAARADDAAAVSRDRFAVVVVQARFLCVAAFHARKALVRPDNQVHF